AHPQSARAGSDRLPRSPKVRPLPRRSCATETQRPMRTRRAPAHNRRPRHAAFTLVEILIVVIIMGILASIIIGLVGNSSRDAGVSALKDNLRGVRSAL